MPLRMIIAHPSAMYRKGLSTFFSGEANMLSIDEVSTSEERERKLNVDLVDVLIVEQSLIRDMPLVLEGDFILITKEPYKTRLLEALATLLTSSEKSYSDDKALTDRDREVFKLKKQHLPNREIAARLNVSETTVKKHVHHILQKLYPDRDQPWKR